VALNEPGGEKRSPKRVRKEVAPGVDEPPVTAAEPSTMPLELPPVWT